MRRVAIVVFALCLLAGAVRAETITELPDVISAPGEITAMYAAGSVLFVGTDDDSMRVYDISTPAQPSLMASVGTFGRPVVEIGMYDMASVVVLTTHYLLVYDFSTVSAPVQRDYQSLTYEVRDMVLRPDSVAVLARSNREVTTVSLKDFDRIMLLHDQYGDVSYAVAMNGQRIYGSGNDSLRVYDLTDPGAPVQVAGMDWGDVTSTDVQSLAAMGDTLFVACRGEGVVVLDYHDLANPVALDTIHDTIGGSDYALDLLLADSTLYVGQGNRNVYSADVSDPANPVLVAAADVIYPAETVLAATGAVLFNSDVLGTLVTRDASDLSELATTSFGNYNEDMVARGDTLIVLGRHGGFEAFDISTPESPVSLFSTGLAGYPEVRGGLIDGNHVYISFYGGGHGLKVFDMSDWSVAAEWSPNTSGPMAMKGDTLVLANYFVDPWDVSDLQNPLDLGTTFVSGMPMFDIEIHGQYAIVAGQNSSAVRIFDLDADGFPEVGEYSGIATACYQLEIEGERLYVAGYNTSFSVLDISDPTNPAPVAENMAFGAEEGLAVRQGFAFTKWSNRFQILDLNDLSDPAGVREVFTDYFYAPAGARNAVALRGDTLVVLKQGSVGMMRIEAAAPTAFGLSLPPDGGVVDQVDQPVQWLPSADINHDDTPSYEVWLGHASDLSDAGAVVTGVTDTNVTLTALADDTTYYWTVKASDNSGHEVWASDTLSFTTFVPEPPSDFSALTPADGTVIDVSGLFPLDFTWSEASDPDPGDQVSYLLEIADNQQFSDSLTWDAGTSLTVTVDQLAIQTWYWRVRAMDQHNQVTYSDTLMLDVTLDVPGGVAGLPERYELSSAYPNPFNPTTAFTVSLPEAARVRAEVFNLLGRRVARLADGQRLAAGAHRFVFDAAGLASGVYFLRVEVPGQLKTTRRLVLMR